jgi:outer membrane protein assembly factor BamB
MKPLTLHSSPHTRRCAASRRIHADALLGAAPEDGKILWRVPLETNAKRHAARALIDGTMVIVNSHETIGLVAFRISKDTGGLKATPRGPIRNLKINLATPVLVDGHFYCQGANKDYICAEAATGKLKWSRPGFGQGKRDYSSTIVVGKNLLVLTEEGTCCCCATQS